MGSPKRNFSTGYQIVKQNFQASLAGLFAKNITEPPATMPSSSTSSFTSFAVCGVHKIRPFKIGVAPYSTKLPTIFLHTHCTTPFVSSTVAI